MAIDAVGVDDGVGLEWGALGDGDWPDWELDGVLQETIKVDMSAGASAASRRQ